MIVFAPFMRVESFNMFQERGVDGSLVSFGVITKPTGL